MNYFYAAFFAAVIFTAPVTILVYFIERKKNDTFYTILISIFLFSIIFLYTLASRITYIGDFF